MLGFASFCVSVPKTRFPLSGPSYKPTNISTHRNRPSRCASSYLSPNINALNGSNSHFKFSVLSRSFCNKSRLQPQDEPVSYAIISEHIPGLAPNYRKSPFSNESEDNLKETNSTSNNDKITDSSTEMEFSPYDTPLHHKKTSPKTNEPGMDSSNVSESLKNSIDQNGDRPTVSSSLIPQIRRSRMKVFIAGPSNHLESSNSSDLSSLIKNSKIEQNVFSLRHGSPEEIMIALHGPASLSYSQTKDLLVDHHRSMTAKANHKFSDYFSFASNPLSSSDISSPTNQYLVSNYEKHIESAKRRIRRWADAVVSCFLPTGFPHSVSSDYKNFYKYLFIHNVAGSFSYVMSMTALLHAVGISSNAMGMAAAVSWVLKDGLGSVGMILAAKVLGDANTFDANTLRSKIRADFLHNFGVALELLTIVFPGAFLLLASGANTFKGIAGLINGACKASINQRMAIANNLGDLTAKGQVQGLAAYLTGLSLGVLYDTVSPFLESLITPLLNYSVNYILPTIGIQIAETAVAGISSTFMVWTFFSLSAMIHLFCSYKALRSLSLPSLNQSRAYLLISSFLKNNPVFDHEASFNPSTSQNSCLPTPFELSAQHKERIITQPQLDYSPKIILGASVSQAFSDAQQDLQVTVKRYLNSPYIVHVDGNSKKIYIVLATSCSSKEILKSFFHACVLRDCMQSTKEELFMSKEEFKHDTSKGSIWNSQKVFELMTQYVDSQYPSFEKALEKSGWRLDQILLSPKPYRADWTVAHPPS